MGTVVIGATSGIPEDRPGLVDAPHPLGGLRGTLMKVGVVALCEPSMRARNLQRRDVARDAEDGIGIEGATAGHDADSTAAGGPPSV
jgi:hypothetical protein